MTGIREASRTPRPEVLSPWRLPGFLVFLGCLLGLSVVPLRAQSVEDQLREMRRDMARMQEEIRALKDEVRRGRSTVGATCAPPESAGNGGYVAAPPQTPQGQQPSPTATMEMVQAQVAELAQTKVESSSRLPVKLFGTIVSSTFFNAGEANWLDLPNIVDPAPGGGLPKGSFSSNLRQSRIGAIIEGPTVGRFRASGFVAFDFFGGIPNFQTGPVLGLPRLLYAYMRLEGERTSIEIGQDHMILAPNNPTSLATMAFPGLFRSGNLYLRVPQIRVEHTIAAGQQGELQFMVGILAPVSGDFGGSFEFVPPNLAGERSRQPAVQARLGWRNPHANLGFSAHTGGRKSTVDSRRSWAAAADFDFRIQRFGFGGEWYVGQNLAAFGGSLGQAAKSRGGYIEGRLKATQKLEFNAGFGTDHLFDRSAFPAPLERNASVFANFIYQLTPEFAGSFEYRWLSTKPDAASTRRNNHLNLVFAYRF